MKTINGIVIFAIVLLFFGTYSCTEDKGNYDYRALKEISIDTLKTRTVEILKELKIQPKITTTVPAEQLTYSWYRYTLDGLQTEVISTERDLNVKISMPVGTHTIYYQVTDSATGLSQKISFQLKVVGKFDAGLMILGEMEGVANLQFLNSANAITEIYGAQNGSKLGKKPLDIVNATVSNGMVSLRDVMVFNGDADGGVLLNNADFLTTGHVTDRFFVKSDPLAFDAYYRGTNPGRYGPLADFIISNGGTKIYPRKLGASFSGVGFDPEISGDYKLSPWAVVNGVAYMFYDNKQKSFLVIKGDMMSLESKFSPIPAQNATLFDPSKVGMELVYMAECSSSGATNRAFCLFKDATGKLVSRIVSLKEYSDPWGVSYMALLASKDVSVTDLGTASGYAMSIAKPFLFYSKGSKIYQYNIDTDSSFEIYDASTQIPGSEIDKIYMEYANDFTGYGSTSATVNKVLYVASRESGKTGRNGSIHVLKLTDSGTVDGTPILHKNICSKVVSLKYLR